MDWKYILSLGTEDINEETKDVLFNMIAWYDCDSDELDLKRSVSLLRLSQEIMKYKSEQVEALLAELDELAMKQGEEEAKRHDSDNDLKSIKSKKSSSIDIDDLDHKYRDLKVKFKKLQKAADRTNADNEKLKQNVKLLEQEREHLQNELERTHHDDSGSDISEAVKDQHKDLIDNLHQKNTHISQLLSDIENIEGENLILRKKLTTVRDELSDATEKLESVTEEIQISNVTLDEMKELVDTLRMENESLKAQIDDIVEDKKQREAEFEEFGQEIDKRIEEWKRILDVKNKEIQDLNAKLANNTPISRSSSSSSIKEDYSQLNVLTKALNDRETQILEFQSQLQTATKEMEDNTEAFEKLLQERDTYLKKYEKVNVLCKEMKKHLKNAHNRCQDLQENVKYQENVVAMKENDVKELINNLDVGDDVKENLILTQDLKTQMRLKEKQISDLVRTCNKLQTTVDTLEKENVALRERLGISEDDYVSTRSVNTQQRKQKKFINNLKIEIQQMEEEKLDYRMEIKKLSSVISNLSDQIIDLGETPNIDHEKCVDKEREIVIVEQDSDTVKKEQYVAVVEENNALRKGLHEILDSVHSKQETSVKEIKSDTLESLLRALDVKHISGWYHPAMRLQAEIHALQGSNNELREQLRLTRDELEKLRDHVPVSFYEKCEQNMETSEDSSSALVIANLNKQLLHVLKNYHLEDENNSTLVKKIEEYQKEFSIIQEQVCLLYNQYNEEKESWDVKCSTIENHKAELEEKANTLEAKINTINIFTDAQTDDEIKAVKAAELSGNLVVLNRKCVYLENQELEYKKQITNMRNDLLCCEKATITKINKLNEEKAILQNRLHIYEEQTSNVKSQEYVKLQNDYDNLIFKERQLIHTIDDIRKVNESELQVLNRQVELLEIEKTELENKLLEAINDRYQLTSDKSNCDYVKKLAQSEVNEMTERQRANHTNNLYELVKEQLQKSEDRFKEYQKYNNEVLHKNLMMQETIKSLEDKIINYVDLDTYKNLETNYVNQLKSHEKLISENAAIQNELAVYKQDVESNKLWTYVDQYEFLNLKHQIVDLQSTSDDKTVIARLSSDVVMARMAETETRKKFEQTLEELNKCQTDKDSFERTNEQDKVKFDIWQKSINKKNRHLEMIINQQREHYIGYIPFTSEYKYVKHIDEVFSAKKSVYENLLQSQNIRNECQHLKDDLELKCEILKELQIMATNGDEQSRILDKWYQDKTDLQLREMRFKRQAEFKEQQLKELSERLNKQEEHIAKTESELLESLIIKDAKIEKYDKNEKPRIELKKSEPTVIDISPVISINKDTQTHNIVEHNITNSNETMHNIITHLENELSIKSKEISSQQELTQQLNLKITELEMNINLLKQQISDKHSQLTFYEKHILELTHKKDQLHEAIKCVDDSQEVHSLRASLSNLQANMTEKEGEILKYQSLLKTDRDEHSLAASRFQEELRLLQSKLLHYEMQAEHKDQKASEYPTRAAIEKYILQVHALENHAAELHTTVTTLNSQLQASREEAVRWRSLASDRLKSVDGLRESLEEQHQNELQAYKDDSDKWREEVKNLQQFVNKYKTDLTELRPDVEKEFKEKDSKIHELTVQIRQLRTNLRRKSGRSQSTSSKDENVEEFKENLTREHEVLKKRFEQLMNREKSAREEIRILKGQLMKRPLLSARSDSSSTKEQQLQKKLSAQDKEIQELKEKLERETALNDTHRIKVNEDFEKWNKQKYWQQTSEKLKAKIKEKSQECEKLQQTCSGYRILIERLEREKHNLEIRIRNFKMNSTNVHLVRQDILAAEYTKLQSENLTLKEKLEMQHHHSGGLGAAMLQEKLESQERKIAILEMSSKGSSELRAELERLQTTNANLQKTSLRLEADNLELRLDLEKSCKELPHLREQLIHLENYIDVLKSEKNEHEVSCSGDHVIQIPESKRVSELERTVFVLKRIVEKLQVENKRLLGGGSRPCSDRVNSAERVKRECNRLKEQYTDSVQKITRLEKELVKLKSKERSQPEDVAGELEDVRGQLKQKAELLDKVKVLLHRAAAKEKSLLEQVSSLKSMIPSDCTQDY